MLPALAVYTPRTSSSRRSSATALPAPRILNEPIGWEFSSLSQISAGASTSSRTSGVRIATPWRRSRAARMSASAGASSMLGQELPERRDGADAFGRGALHDVVRSGEIFDRNAERFKER